MTAYSPSYIKSELDKYVSGQEDAKKALSILGYNHWLRMYHAGNRFDNLPEPPRLTGLICGPTGTGKTLLIDSLCKIMDLPVLKLDATQLSNPGYVGMDLGDYMESYIEKYRNDYKADLLGRGICFIDEVDKLNSDGNWFQEKIQSTLLTVLEGTEYQINKFDSLNTKNMLFILAGAFEAQYDKRKTTDIGFKGLVKGPGHFKDNYTSPLTRKELESSGLKRELIGRISVTTYTTHLTKDMIREALSTVSDNPLDQYHSMFLMSGAYEDSDEKDIDEIVDKIYESPYGMRHAKSILFEHFRDRIFQLEGIRKQRIKVTEEPQLQLEMHPDPDEFPELEDSFEQDYDDFDPDDPASKARLIRQIEYNLDKVNPRIKYAVELLYKLKEEVK